MTKGKICAQVGHATMGAITRYLMNPRDLLMLKPISGSQQKKSKEVNGTKVKETEEDQDEDEDYDEDYEDGEDEFDDDNTISNEELERVLYGDSDDDDDEDQDHINQVFAEALTMADNVHADLDNNKTPEEVEASIKAAMEATSAIFALTQQKNEAKKSYDDILKELYNCNVPLKVLMRYMIGKWINVGQGKIAVKVKDEKELKSIKKALRKVGVPTFDVHDAGHTQVAAGSLTVMAVGPFPDDIINPICSHLKLL